MQTLLLSIALLQPLLQPLPQGAVPPAAVMRSSPEVDQIRLTVGLYRTEDTNPNVQQSPNQLGTAIGLAPFVFDATTIAVPLLARTSWCDVDLSGLDARTYLDGRETRLDPATVFHRLPGGVETLLRFGISGGQRGVNEIRTQATFLVQRWEVDVDEGRAAASTWPRSWPAWTERYLGRELGIDPTDPGIRSVAEQATPGGPRSVSPYVAARNAVLAIVGRWKALSGGSSEHNVDGTLRGIAFTNGPSGLAAGRGTQVELAVTCVAALRSIGIPARVVYCIHQDGGGTRNRPICKFRYVGEFFLDGIGWIPFDPAQIRASGGATRGRGGAVKGFANVDDLEELLPLAFRPVPEGFAQADRMAVWGWEPGRVQVESDLASSRILFEDSSRGNGKIPSMPAPISDESP